MYFELFLKELDLQLLYYISNDTKILTLGLKLTDKLGVTISN